jgi:hypothetical protein
MLAATERDPIPTTEYIEFDRRMWVSSCLRRLMPHHDELARLYWLATTDERLDFLHKNELWLAWKEVRNGGDSPARMHRRHAGDDTADFDFSFFDKLIVDKSKEEYLGRTGQQIRVDTKESIMPAAQPMPLPANLVARTDTDWAEVDGHSTPVPTCSDNVRVFLRRVDTTVRFNNWLERPEICQGGAPWVPLADFHVDELMTVAANAMHRFRPAEAVFRRALSKLARENQVDPALDRLDELERAWDGEHRLAAFLTKACGTECDPYHQAVGRILIGGMVRRIRNPGCQFDLMPVLEGPQGAGKSTLAKIVALDPTWFLDNVQLGLESKELLPLLRGKAVVEISEMRSRGEVDAVKAMLSRTDDEARTAYAREPVRRPRRNIFIGSTNEPEMLEDATGNRRFLPINVPAEIDLAWLRANIEQLVGEACALETKGETFRLPRELWADAARRQEESRALADYEELLLNLFAPERGPLVIKAADLQKRLHNYVGKSVSSKAYGKVMRKLGFVRVHDDFTYGDRKVAERVWRRGTKEEAILLPQMTPLPPLPQLKPN